MACSHASTANAGGYDSFISHTARYVGLGGAGVSYAADPAAVYHNPAGLVGIEKAEVMIGVGLIIPQLITAPAEGVQADNLSMVAPMGLLGGGVRLTKWLALGMAAYPIAAAGASYRYERAADEMLDEARAVLGEVSPAIAIQLPEGFRLGFGYRITGMYMKRYLKGDVAAQPAIDMRMLGFNFRGFRVGAQWEKSWRDSPIAARSIQLGASYRHTVKIDTDGSGGHAMASPIQQVETAFTFPARLAVGVRGDFNRFAATVDFEYGFNAQNDRQDVHVELENGGTATLPNIFAWQNTVGIRSGVEYRALDAGRMPIRLGYAFDGQTVPKAYPTPFGPPPAPTHMVTCGLGYRVGPIETSLAYSYRFGSTTVTDQDVEDSGFCAFCGYPGKYQAKIHGIYIDFSYTFGAR